jgi:hypothetical protein
MISSGTFISWPRVHKLSKNMQATSNSTCQKGNTKFHMKNPQTLENTVQNLVTDDLCTPVLDKTNSSFCLQLSCICINHPSSIHSAFIDHVFFLFWLFLISLHFSNNPLLLSYWSSWDSKQAPHEYKSAALLSMPTCSLTFLQFHVALWAYLACQWI